jgi:hypothetical protein
MSGNVGIIYKTDVRVEAVVTDHRETFLGKGALIFEHRVEILQLLAMKKIFCIRTHLVMTPAQHNVIQTTVRLVYTILARVQ